MRTGARRARRPGQAMHEHTQTILISPAFIIFTHTPSSSPPASILVPSSAAVAVCGARRANGSMLASKSACSGSLLAIWKFPDIEPLPGMDTKEQYSKNRPGGRMG